MKRCIVALAMLTSVSAFSQTAASIALTVGQWISKESKRVYYVQVESTADTSDMARQAAFRKATELAVGAIVLGETESDGRQIIRNDVTTYSSGYVEDYKILNETRVGNQTRMTVDVWVSDSKIANRLTTIGANSGAAIDGAAIKREWQIDNARATTDAERRRNGERVITALARDYPKLALQPTVEKTWVGTNNGVTTLFVKVDIKFSKPYIEALDEALNATRDGTIGKQGWTGVSLHYGFLNMSGPRAMYSSPTIPNIIDSALFSNVSMKLTFLGASKPYTNCWMDVREKSLDGKLFGSMVDSNGRKYNDTIIKGDRTVSHTYAFENRPSWGWSDEKFINWVTKFTKVEAQVVDTASCP